MKLAVFGLWHLGSVTAACAAAANISTVGIDLDRDKIARLSSGEPPLYEPGLTELIRAGLSAGTLSFSAELASVGDADIVWICHDTPVDDEDRADVDLVMREAGMLFRHLKDGAVVLVSAQLPVGSVAALERSFAAQANGRTASFACSPENLRLGRAIEVFRNPGRIVVGVRDERVRAPLEALLGKFCPSLIWMSVESAEMVKHGLNAFLAASVSFTNELAIVCERVGADASEVECGLRTDPRVGPNAYVRAGPAFAGGTLARDVNFLRTLAKRHGLSLPVMDGIIASNRAHGQWAYGRLREALQPLSGRTIGVLGLAYKPGTSALRRSPAIDLIQALVRDGAHVQAFDPHVSRLPDELASTVRLCDDARSAVSGVDALVVANECPEFRSLSADDVAGAMKGRIVLDAGRFLAATLAADARLSLISVGRTS
jgi:UDPglucose 6-dehydrogenase